MDNRQGDELDAREISAELNRNVAAVVGACLPGAVKSGGMWHAGSIKGESGNSLKVKANGTWADYAFAKGDPLGHGDMLKLLYLTIGGQSWRETFSQARKLLKHEDMDPHALAAHRRRAAAAAQRAEVENADKVAKSRLKARNLWFHASPIIGTPAMRYLEGRGIDFALIGRVPGSMRFRHDVWHADLKRPVPALLTAGLLGNQHVATHCIYLDRKADGSWGKLPDLEVDGKRLKIAKKIFGQQPQGVHFPIIKGRTRKTLVDMPAGERISSAEGAEDALTYAMIHPEERIVFAGTLGLLGAMALPPQCGDFTILAQRDDEGSPAAESFEKQVSAQQLRARQDGSHRRVMCIWPEEGFKDLNDEWRGIRMDGGRNDAQK
ncbi:hypothetical protein [Novosphingobium sp.]|uniref:DUF7146 domain-containing protein n=1 Tax=Novosphingobium sp. TaxID=1874826 RepID=UPI0031E3202E